MEFMTTVVGKDGYWLRKCEGQVSGGAASVIESHVLPDDYFKEVLAGWSLSLRIRFKGRLRAGSVGVSPSNTQPGQVPSFDESECNFRREVIKRQMLPTILNMFNAIVQCSGVQCLIRVVPSWLEWCGARREVASEQKEVASE